MLKSSLLILQLQARKEPPNKNVTGEAKAEQSNIMRLHTRHKVPISRLDGTYSQFLPTLRLLLVPGRSIWKTSMHVSCCGWNMMMVYRKNWRQSMSLLHAGAWINTAQPYSTQNGLQECPEGKEATLKQDSPVDAQQHQDWGKTHTGRCTVVCTGSVKKVQKTLHDIKIVFLARKILEELEKIQSMVTWWVCQLHVFHKLTLELGGSQLRKLLMLIFCSSCTAWIGSLCHNVG